METKEVININQDVANFLTLSLIVLHRLKTPSFLSNSFSLLSNVGRVKVKKPHLSHSVLFLPPTKLATRKLLLVYSTLLKKLHDKILIMYCKLCFVLCSALLKNALQSVRTKKNHPHTKQLQQLQDEFSYRVLVFCPVEQDFLLFQLLFLNITLKN